MDTENSALSLDSAVELLRAPEAPEAAEAEQITEQPTVEAPEDTPGEAVDETETEAEAPDEQAAEDVDEEPDEAAEPSIEPPTFWSKAAKEAFAKLTPDDQREFVKVEKAREAEVTRIQQEHAAERKALADREAAFEQERQQYQDALLQYLPQPPDEALIDDDPVEYMRQDAHYRRQMSEYQQAIAQRQADQQKAQAQEAARYAETMKAEAAKLAGLIPGIANPEKGPQLKQQIASYAHEAGYDADTLAQASAADIHTLWKAMQWDNAQKAARAAKSRPVPKVAAPGVGRSKAELVADQRKSALARLERSGSIEDAVALLRQ